MNNLWNDAFKLYKINPKLSKTNTDKVRNGIRRSYEKEYGKKYHDDDWFKLPPLEKQRFLYVVIKDKMLEKYVDDSKKKTIKKEIDKFVSESFLKYQKTLDNLIDASNELYTSFYNTNDSEKTKEEKYKEFCNVLATINPKITLPTLEEWKNSNEQWIAYNVDKGIMNYKTLRPYDYLMDCQDKDIQSTESDDTSIKEEVNEIIFKTIIKSLDIDVNRIQEAVKYVKSFENKYSDMGLLHFNINSYEESDNKEVLIEYGKYQTYKKELEDLDFKK